MALSIVNQGLTAIRVAIEGIVSHVGVATDTTAFSASQTALDPANGGASNLLIQSSTIEAVDSVTFDATMIIDGDTQFTGLNIRTIGILDGSARTDVLARVVRGAAIGVEAGDLIKIGLRVSVADAG